MTRTKLQDLPERPFIDAKDNRFVASFFYMFSRFLAKRTFREVRLDNPYGSRIADRSTLYFGNHNSWWDALTPLLLNQNIFRQHPRAVMEWEQVNRYAFFRRIGCYSIDRTNLRSAMTSLEYGVNWLNKRPGRSLYFYPEGKITNPSLPDSPFESGLAWMIPKLDTHVDLVPLIQHSHMMHHAKPTLFLRVCKPILINELPHGRKELLKALEDIIMYEKAKLVHDASPKTPEIKVWF
jgi:1-acyl-sn-glycerol-3-phosphate acyltransferase